MSFLDIAAPLTDLGIAVFPLAPRSKEPPSGLKFLTEATTDPQKLGEWDAEDPNYNVALLANDQFCFLEFDIRHGLKQAAAEMGAMIPATRYQASGKGFLHCIFRHTERSRALGNRSVNLPEPCSCHKQEPKTCMEPKCRETEPHHHHEWFSFRARNKYLVGAGSTHPNGNLYELKRDVEPIPVPDWILDFVEKHSVAPRVPSKSTMRSVSDEFDFDEFIDHYDITIRGEKDDVWQIVEECPGVGYRHENSFLTGFFWDGDSLGWSCFAQGCPTHGIGIGGLIKFLNQTHDPYPGVIWEREDDDTLMEQWGVEVLDDDDLEQVLTPTPTKPVIEDVEALLNEPIQYTPNPDPTNPGTYIGEDGVVRLLPIGLRLKPVAEEEEPEEQEEPKSKADPTWKVRGQHNPDENTGLLFITKSAADYSMRELSWLWPQKIPRGKMTLYTGKPDCGKTLCCLDLVARVSTGTDFPDGTKNEHGPGKVLIASSEDDPEDTLVPRLAAAGADLHNVELVIGTAVSKKGKKGKKKRQMSLQQDLKLLTVAIEQNPDIKLLVLDPISSYLGGVNQNEDKDVRPIMDGLKAACEKSGLTIVAMVHSNKRSDVDAMDKVSGARSLGAAVRAVWQFNRDPEEKGKYHMTNVKGNISKDKRGLTYSIVEHQVEMEGKPVGVPRIEWGEVTEENADDQLAAGRERKDKSSTKVTIAKAFLRSQRYPVKAKDMYDRGQLQEGLTEKNLKDAKRLLSEDGFHIIAKKSYDGWYWHVLGEDGKVDSFTEPENMTIPIEVVE